MAMPLSELLPRPRNKTQWVEHDEEEEEEEEKQEKKGLRNTTITTTNKNEEEEDGRRRHPEKGNRGSKETVGLEQRIQPQRSSIPNYGKRQGWKPHSLEDFGRGGAFPEIHVAQYPLEMGRKVEANKTRDVVHVQVDSQGKMKYDVLATQGKKDKVVYSKFKDLLPMSLKEGREEHIEKPTEEELRKTTEDTKMALEKIVNDRVQAGQSGHIQGQVAPAHYVRYTPLQQGSHQPGMNRIIKMMETPVDPLEPPRFKHKRIPAAPPSPPPPVMHSPPRKVTVEEQREWKIPPSVSNWKNPKGYVIPLDKRLASDGRGLQEMHVNDNFAKLAEALYIADRQAREEVEKRASIQRKLAEKEKESKEESLRQLAQKAREERSSIFVQRKTDRDPQGEERGKNKDEDEEENRHVREREEIRHERRKEIERELRLSRMGSENRQRITGREEERDISEKIALGIARPTVSKDMLYDQRLFNQNVGVGSTLGDDEVYNLYDKPLLASSAASSIYRPRQDMDQDTYGGSHEDALSKIIQTDRFQPDKGFQGAESAQHREGPVQFERVTEADPFGLDQFLTEAKKGKRAMENIGSRGQLHAGSSGGGVLGKSDPSQRRRLDFEHDSSGRKRTRHDDD